MKKERYAEVPGDMDGGAQRTQPRGHGRIPRRAEGVVSAPRHGLSTDQQYLRESQYKDPSNLNVRIALHAKYSRSDEPWFQWLAARVDWPEGADVLEAGCGSGNLWANIGPLLPHIRLTLTDLSEGMVEAARPDRGAARERRAGADALAGATSQDLPFDDDAFDVVVANHMLYHVPDADRATAESGWSCGREECCWRPPTARIISSSSGRCREIRHRLVRPRLHGRPLRTLERGGHPPPCCSTTWSGSTIRPPWWSPTPTTSSPSSCRLAAGDVATPEQQARLPRSRGRALEEEGGTVHMTTEAGCFVARGPRPRTDG